MTEPAVGRGQKPPDGLQPSAWGTGTAPQPPTPLLHGGRVQGKAGASGGNKVRGNKRGEKRRSEAERERGGHGKKRGEQTGPDLVKWGRRREEEEAQSGRKVGAGWGEKRDKGGKAAGGAGQGEKRWGRRVSLLCRPPAQAGLWTLGLRSRARPADLSASIPLPSRRKLSCGASADRVRGRGPYANHGGGDVKRPRPLPDHAPRVCPRSCGGGSPLCVSGAGAQSAAGTWGNPESCGSPRDAGIWCSP